MTDLTHINVGEADLQLHGECATRSLTFAELTG